MAIENNKLGNNRPNLSANSANNQQASRPQPAKQPAIHASFAEDSHISIFRIAAALAIVLVLFSLVYLVFPKSQDCGTDADCFMAAANLCGAAVMQDTIGDGTIVKYETDNCVLKKYISKFSETEPVEVVTFFDKKQMTCRFEQNDFNPFLVTGLAFGLDQCDGELKDAIIELRLAQLSLGQ